MATKIGINGFGRVGRAFLRAMAKSKVDDLEVVAVNDLADTKTLAHLLRHDTVHGRFDAEVEAGEGRIVVDGRTIQVRQEADPAKLDWGQLGVEIVIDASGKFRERSKAAKHLEAGARKVIVSAPVKEPDATFVVGINADTYDPNEHHVVSNASCTTNCVAPVVRVLLDSFGFEHGLMTTVHAYTADQRLLDTPHKDLRRARAAAANIIPTSTGAAAATGLVIPEVAGKLDGMAMRVPTTDVSVVDLVATLGRDVTVDDVNAALRRAALEGPLAGILAYSDEPLVSVDYVGNPASSIVDGLSTSVVGNRMVKVLSWYDNEWGYASRCVDLARLMAAKL